MIIPNLMNLRRASSTYCNINACHRYDTQRQLVIDTLRANVNNHYHLNIFRIKRLTITTAPQKARDQTNLVDIRRNNTNEIEVQYRT